MGELLYISPPLGVLVYFAFVIDVFSRIIVGWQLAASMQTTLVLDALRMALCLCEPGADFELVAHTGASSQTRVNRSSQQCLSTDCISRE